MPPFNWDANFVSIKNCGTKIVIKLTELGRKIDDANFFSSGLPEAISEAHLDICIAGEDNLFSKSFFELNESGGMQIEEGGSVVIILVSSIIPHGIIPPGSKLKVWGPEGPCAFSSIIT